ncbi:MAG: hypothetical protein WDO69_35460 [Pseudomonadota bacterium]
MVRNLHNARLLAVLFACLGGHVALIGCSSTSGNGADSAETDSENSGSIGLALQVESGLTLNQIDYAIIGPLGFSKSGSIDVSNSSTISAVISSLPAGTGYSITLSGTSTDGSATCSGSATFDVVAHQTTTASVGVSCHQAATTGSVQINGAVNVCPVADGISANPAEVAVGSTIALSASAHDSDSGPAPLAYSWTASSGTLSDPASATPTFTCTAPGTVTLTVGVSDGDLAEGCTDIATTTVTCSVTAAQVQAILNTNCTSCHSGPNPSRGLSLVDVKTAVGVPAAGCTQKLRIFSGSSAQSYLVDKLLGAAQDGGCFSGKQMPLNRPPLAAADLATITSWINAGTP